MTAETSSARSGGRVSSAFALGSRLLDGIRLRVEGWAERFRLRCEFDSLRRQGELDRTLIDTGIAPSDVSRLMRSHPRTAEQLAEMMRRLGIYRAGLPRSSAVAETLREMEWRCGECADWRQCRDWLASRYVQGSYRAFCPNAAVLDELRCSDPASSGSGLRKSRSIATESEA